MRTSLAERVENAFDGETQEAFGEKYLELVYGNWADVVRRLRRTVALATLLAIGFFLLEGARGGELVFGPLKTSNLAAVLTLIPAVTSFLLFEAIDLTIAGSYYHRTVDTLIKRLYPSIRENDLQYMLQPAAMFAWGAGSTPGLKPVSKDGIEALLENAAVASIVGTVFAFVGFLVYAYWELYGNGTTNSVAVSVSLAFAIFNIARATLVLADALRDE